MSKAKFAIIAAATSLFAVAGVWAPAEAGQRHHGQGLIFIGGGHGHGHNQGHGHRHNHGHGHVNGH